MTRTDTDMQKTVVSPEQYHVRVQGHDDRVTSHGLHRPPVGRNASPLDYGQRSILAQGRAPAWAVLTSCKSSCILVTILEAPCVEIITRQRNRRSPRKQTLDPIDNLHIIQVRIAEESLSNKRNRFPHYEGFWTLTLRAPLTLPCGQLHRPTPARWISPTTSHAA